MVQSNRLVSNKINNMRMTYYDQKRNKRCDWWWFSGFSVVVYIMDGAALASEHDAQNFLKSPFARPQPHFN